MQPAIRNLVFAARQEIPNSHCKPSAKVFFHQVIVYLDIVPLKIPPLDETEPLAIKEAASRFAGLHVKTRHPHCQSGAFKPLVERRPNTGSDGIRMAIEAVNMTVFFQLYESNRFVILAHSDENGSTIGHTGEKFVGRDWLWAPGFYLSLIVVFSAHGTDGLMKDRGKRSGVIGFEIADFHACDLTGWQATVNGSSVRKAAPRTFLHATQMAAEK